MKFESLNDDFESDDPTQNACSREEDKNYRITLDHASMVPTSR